MTRGTKTATRSTSPPDNGVSVAYAMNARPVRNPTPALAAPASRARVLATRVRRVRRAIPATSAAPARRAIPASAPRRVILARRVTRSIAVAEVPSLARNPARNRVTHLRFAVPLCPAARTAQMPLHGLRIPLETAF